MAEPQIGHALDPQLTNVVNAVPVTNFMADRVLPVIFIDQQTYSWTKIPEGQFFRLTNSRVGARGEVNEVLFHGQDVSGKAVPYALKAPVPTLSSMQASRYFNPRATASTGVSHHVDQNREKRVADMVFNTNNYAQKTTLVGANQWSDPTSDPTREVLKKKRLLKPFVPNRMILGADVATWLTIHPKLIGAFHAATRGNAGEEGVVDLGWLASFWGFDEIIVGEAVYDTSGPGETSSYTDIWSNRAAMIHFNGNFTLTSGGAVQILTWGAQFVMRIRGQRKAVSRWVDKGKGVDQVEYVKVGEIQAEQLINDRMGYLWIDASAVVS